MHRGRQAMNIKPAIYSLGVVLTAVKLVHAQPIAQSTGGHGKPKIMFILMDNLGFGEVGCYGGGILRGVATPRIASRPAMKIVTQFEQSLKRYPPIAPGTSDPYTPPKSRPAK